MTVASEIQRINTNIFNAYAACDSKGATLPATQNSANLATCINSISTASGNGIGIPREISSSGTYQLPTSSYTFTLPSGVTNLGQRALAQAFMSSSYLVALDLSALTEITGAGAMQGACQYCTNLVSADLSNVVRITGSNALYMAFTSDTKLETLNFAKLETISGSSCMNYMCRDCSLLYQVNFSSLSSIIGSYIFQNAFYNCKKLLSLYFPSLTVSSFGSYTNQFYQMLYGVDGCTVHFPASLKTLLSEWSDVKSGFGGTNTKVVFDLHAAEIDFVSSDATIYINEQTLTGTNPIAYLTPEDTTYVAYNSTSNTILIDTLTDLVIDTTRSVTVDLTQNASKISISTGISGLDCKFYIGNIEIPAVEETAGVYSINVIGNNKSLSYFVYGGDNYQDATGTITTTGSDMTVTVNLSAVTWNTFTRPNLTSNGTLGGSSFAVDATGTYSSDYAPYMAVNGSSNYWWGSLSTNYYTFYNPEALKLTTLLITYSSSSQVYVAGSIKVQGSNNNINWTDIVTSAYVAGISRTVEVNSTKAYKYHRLIMPPKSSYVRITDIAITASYKS